MDRYSRHPGRAGFTREQLIDMLQDLWASKGINPTTRDCDRGAHGLPSRKVFSRLFGSLDAAKAEAGLPVGEAPAPKPSGKTSKAKVNKVARGHL